MEHKVRSLDRVVVRFAGDSGDGMQLTGARFGAVSAQIGNDIVTLPDYPAEIRAPQGSLGGVSSFQVHFADSAIATPGEQVDALIAMNPAALKVHLPALKRGGVLITDTSQYTRRNLEKAGYRSNPLDGLSGYQLVSVDITAMTRGAVEAFQLKRKDGAKCRNMFALGLVNWLYGRPNESVEEWLATKFAASPKILGANIAALNAGHAFGETLEEFAVRYQVDQADLPPGRYRQVSGTQALALGLLAAAWASGRQLFLGAYPITPASDLLHELSRRKNQGVMVFQAEDEIAAAGAALGAAFGGALGVTVTSGPGFTLKQEMMNLAVMTELPLVVLDIMRAGPATGMPTKTEQADLLQALWGRNGSSPLPVLAPKSPADCFDTVFRAAKIALEYRTPVVVLADAYLVNGSQPWLFPNPKDLPVIDPQFYHGDPEQFQPYMRDERLARAWALPGIEGLEHRVGGLEKSQPAGAVSYDGDNHDAMVNQRAKRIDNIVVADAEIDDPEGADTVIVGWGSAWGAVAEAVRLLRGEGRKVARVHVPTLRPLPKNLGQALKRYRHVIVAEVNLGQLRLLLRATYLVDAIGFNKLRGKPLSANELADFVRGVLDE